MVAPAQPAYDFDALDRAIRRSCARLYPSRTLDREDFVQIGWQGVLEVMAQTGHSVEPAMAACIARRRVVDELRRLKDATRKDRGPIIQMVELGDYAETLATEPHRPETERAEQLERVHRVLANLKPRDRAIVVHAASGVPYKQWYHLFYGSVRSAHVRSSVLIRKLRAKLQTPSQAHG